MSPTFSDDDIGKGVVTAAGAMIGRVTDVEGETAYVDPDPGIGDSIAAALDWGETSDRPLPLASDAVRTIRDETIELEDEYSAERDETDESDGAPDASSGAHGSETDTSDPAYRQDETDAEPDALEGSDPESGVGRQDETDLEPDDLDETDPELDDFDGSDPGVEGDPDDPSLTDAAGEIDGDRERRTDPTADPLEEAGGSGGGGSSADAETGSGTREDVDVDPTELLDEERDEREDEA